MKRQYFAVIRSRNFRNAAGEGTLEHVGMPLNLRDAILCAEVRTILAARQGAGPWTVDYMGADGFLHPVPLDDPDYLALCGVLGSQDSLDYAEDVLCASPREMSILLEEYGGA